MKIYYFSLNQKEIERDSMVCSTIAIYNVQKLLIDYIFKLTFILKNKIKLKIFLFLQ